MDDSKTSYAVALVGVRLLALGFLMVGLWLLITRGAEYAADFDPIYLFDFMLLRMVDPIAALIIGLCAYLLSKSLAAKLAG
ncbi:MAG: hypothetical protein AAGA18_00400 [Verrucomicrobiota bacterium]